MFEKLFTFKIPILLLLFFLTLSVRMYKVSEPLADWHSWRQVDTSAVSRIFIESGVDLLHPKFHDLSNVPSGKDNPEGYRYVEFPIYNLFQAGLFRIFGGFNLETWGRIVSAISASFACICIYLLVRKHADDVSAFFAAFFFAMLPFNIFYGRTVLPDTMMVMASLGGIYFFDRWVDHTRKEQNGKYFWFALSLVFTTAAFLLKPYALIFTLPMVVLAWQRFGWKGIMKWQLWLFLILSVIPLIWWRSWMTQFPQGIPANDWLFNGGNIRFKGAFFYWIFADRIGRLILGYWGMGLFISGLLAISDTLKKNGIFFYSFLLSSFIYLTVIARGNVQHDYYQTLIIPSVAIFVGLGARLLLFPPQKVFHPVISRILFAVCTVFTIGFGWFFVRDYYNINNRAILVAGDAVDRLTPKNAKVIAPYDGDTTFLYYTKRKGWASFQNPLPEMITKGATHLVLVNPAERDFEIGDTYQIISSSKEYILFDLRQMK